MTNDPQSEVVNLNTCGLIMPISDSEGYERGHWAEVREIVVNSLADIKDITVRLVSEQKDVTTIQKTIVQNIFADEIVVADISSLNPNVMLELGLRLAFDKPFIIIKDKKTDSPFDISSIRYIEYPTDLRHKQVTEFQEELKATFLAVLNNYKKDVRGYSQFLKEFTFINPKGLASREVDQAEYLTSRFDQMESKLASVVRIVKDVSRGRPQEFKSGIGDVLKSTSGRKVFKEDFVVEEYLELKNIKFNELDAEGIANLTNEIVDYGAEIHAFELDFGDVLGSIIKLNSL